MVELVIDGDVVGEADLSDEDEYLDEDELISFLNEYYIVYPKKLPKGQMK